MEFSVYIMRETNQQWGRKGTNGRANRGRELDRMQAPGTPRVATPYPTKSVARCSRSSACHKMAAQPRQPPLPLPASLLLISKQSLPPSHASQSNNTRFLSISITHLPISRSLSAAIRCATFWVCVWRTLLQWHRWQLLWLDPALWLLLPRACLPPLCLDPRAECPDSPLWPLGSTVPGLSPCGLANLPMRWEIVCCILSFLDVIELFSNSTWDLVVFAYNTFHIR